MDASLPGWPDSDWLHSAPIACTRIHLDLEETKRESG